MNRGSSDRGCHAVGADNLLILVGSRLPCRIMGVAPYTLRNENSALPVEFKRGSNPPTTATPLPNTDGSALSAWTGYSLTTPIPPARPEPRGSSRAGRIWPPDLVDDDEVGYASPHSGDVWPYARAFAAWPADHPSGVQLPR